MPLVSIITACYDAEKFLEETYLSILRQTHGNWEWVVVDDRSTDTSYDILARLAKNDTRIKLLRNDVNLGAAASRNRAMKLAEGEFLAFLDADDLWESKKLAMQLRFMIESDIGFSFTNYRVFTEGTDDIGRMIDGRAPERVGYHDMLGKRATLGCSTVMLRTRNLTSREMPDIRTGQDYAFWLKLLKSGGYAYRLDEPLSHYRVVQGSLSRNKAKKAVRQWEIYRRVEGLSFLVASYYFLQYGWRAIFRR